MPWRTAGKRVDVLLDIDSGQHRTGVPADSAEARALYKQIAEAKGLVAGGLHLYDGHNHQRDFEERKTAVLAGWNAAAALRDELVRGGIERAADCGWGDGFVSDFCGD